MATAQLVTQSQVRRGDVVSCCALLLVAACSSGSHDQPLGAGDARASSFDAGSFDAPNAHTSEADSHPRTENGAGTVLPALCARDGQDPVRDVFCGERAQVISSLPALMHALSLDTYQTNEGSYGSMVEDAGGVASTPLPDAGVVLSLNVTLLGHSTALSGMLVSPINPRIIVMGEKTTLAFHRGIQRVELVTRATGTGRPVFYLVSFGQACNGAPTGCTPGDLYTPRIESDWQSVQVQDDEDLKNTNADCRQCHQRGSDKPGLLMRETTGPWTHFFAQDVDGKADFSYPEPLGRDLVQDYRRAKGDEPYAGVPSNILRATMGLALVPRVGFDQPLFFDSSTILNERWPKGPSGFSAEPRRSATWDKEYGAFKRGEHLPLPYFAGRATDAAKQAALSDAYQRFRAGQLSAEALPDLADIYPDDPQVRAEIGLQTEPGASGAEVLIQACGSCHNDVLDQTVTRARFSIDLARMDRAELELAVTRVQQASDEAGAMPPPETRQLDEEARATLIDYLLRPTRSADEDAMLGRAAELGMAVPLRMPAPTR